MKNKKGLIIIIVFIIVVAIAVGGFFAYKFFFNGSSGKDAVYVEKVSSLMGTSLNVSNSYMGVVESQDTLDVNKASDREVDEIYVSVGDEVEVGQKLFSYTTIDIKSEIVQYQFDLEEYDLQIAEYNRQISVLEGEKSETDDDDEIADIQCSIDAVVNSIAIAENNKKSVNTQIEAAKKKIDSSVVTATMAGTIQSVNKEGVDANGNSAAFIKILASGDVRVKCKINETNVWSISEGMPVVVRSRVNDSTWTGVVSKINTSEKAQNEGGSSYYYGYNDGSDSSTNYNFYVELDNSDGLMMGQHLYVEPNDGNVSVNLGDGIYLYDYYIAYDEEDNPFVWAANSSMKLEKRKISLGSYNDGLMAYEILDGISDDDYVTYPMEYLYEGVKCVLSYDEVDMTSPMYQQDSFNDFSDDFEYTDEMIDDESINDVIEVAPTEDIKEEGAN